MDIQSHNAVSFFDLGDDSIRVESSFLTGQEKVFLNEQLISKKLTWRFTSVHAFELKQQHIEVKFRVGNILRGPVVIELWVDGQMKDSDEWDLKGSLKQSHGVQRKGSWPGTLLMIFIWSMAGAAVGFGLAFLFKG